MHEQYAQHSYQDFCDEIERLQDELTVKERGLKHLVRTCFDDFVLAKAQVDVVYQSHAMMPQ